MTPESACAVQISRQEFTDGQPASKPPLELRLKKVIDFSQYPDIGLSLITRRTIEHDTKSNRKVS